MAVSLSLSFVALVSALLLVTARQAVEDPTGADADSRAELTLKGIFNYFWKKDPYNKKVEFLFSCGQIGQTGSAQLSQCSCYDLSSCVNCFRWWTGITVESVATYGIHMNTTNHSSLPDVVYNHSPYNANWDPASHPQCTHIDDFLWYGIAYLRVYDWLSVSIQITVLAIDHCCSFVLILISWHFTPSSLISCYDTRKQATNAYSSLLCD